MGEECVLNGRGVRVRVEWVWEGYTEGQTRRAVDIQSPVKRRDVSRLELTGCVHTRNKITRNSTMDFNNSNNNNNEILIKRESLVQPELGALYRKKAKTVQQQ